MQQAIFTNGKVNGVPTLLLVDTGSAVTIIHRRLWEQGQASTLQKVDGGPIVAANGQSLSILGQVKSHILLAGGEFIHDVLVADDVSQDCLLGADFLTAHGFIIDFNSRMLCKGDLSAPLVTSHNPTREVCRVSIGEPVVVRAGEERVFFAKVDGISHSFPAAGVLEPKEGFEVRHQLLLARVVAVPDNGVVPLRVANLSTEVVTLHRGTTIGKFYPLSGTSVGDAEYCEVPMERAGDERSVHQVKVDLSAADFLGIDTTNMDQYQRGALEELVREFSDVFSTGKQDLGRTDLVYHSINTGNQDPIKQAPRRLPIHYKQEVGKMLEEMQQQGVIEPSNSPWASPVVLVRKKDGSLRFCIDYRKLNKVTRKDSYPLPRVDDLLDSLSDAQWFSTLDLRSGYWQVEIDPGDREKTAFSTQNGLFQFRVMPFGLCNAPSTFQRLMELVLAGLSWEVCLAYLDDVVIFGRTWEEHLERLRIVLIRLREAHLKLHPKKCQFFRKCIVFLGHVISNSGVSTDPEKISSIVNWPTPTNVTELRSFLGLASYYRRFICRFAEVAAPLHRLQEKAISFQWSEQCNTAFETLKRRLSSAPVLAFPRSSDTFILDTDASEHGIGAVLSQNQHGVERVIAYGSRTLTKSERNYCVTRRELLALIYFLRHFRSYLLGRPFIVRTDHAALKWIQQFKEPEGQIARWLEYLQEFDFQTEYRPGKWHGNADALSRLQCNQCEICHSFSATLSSHPSPSSNQLPVHDSSQEVDCWVPIWTNKELHEKQKADPVLSIIFSWMEKGQDRPPETAVAGTGRAVRSLWAQWNRLEMVNSLLYRQWEEANTGDIRRQLIVPQALVPEVISALHNQPGGGHLGMHKTLAKVRDRFYWPGLQKDVEHWCRCLPGLC